MIPIILILLTIPFIEVYLYVVSIELIGGWYSFLFSFLMTCIGFYFLKITGFQVIRNVQLDLAKSKLPTVQILKGAVRFIAAILLIIPGFLTDFLGLILLLPGFSQLFIFLLAQKIDLAIKRGALKVYQNFNFQNVDQTIQKLDEIIEVDYGPTDKKDEGI